jgi:hypothetical protein
MGGLPPFKESMMKYEVQYNSVIFRGWVPLFLRVDGTNKQHDVYTEALRAFTDHVNAMIDSDEGDDVNLEDYRIAEVDDVHV